MKLTRKGFRAWLESKHPRTVVGVRRRVRSCPIARYLNANGYLCAEVDDSWFLLDASDLNATRDKLPVWGREFIIVVDDNLQNNITASRALKILDGDVK